MSEASISLFSKLLQKDQEISEIRSTVKELQEEKKSLEFLLLKSSEEIRRLSQQIQQQPQSNAIPIVQVGSVPSPSNGPPLELQNAIWNAYSVIQHLNNTLEQTQKKVEQFKKKHKKSKLEISSLKKESSTKNDRILQLTETLSQKSQEAERMEKTLNEKITIQGKQIESLGSELAEKDKDISKQIEDLEKISSEFKAKESTQSKQLVFLRIENLKLKTAADAKSPSEGDSFTASATNKPSNHTTATMTTAQFCQQQQQNQQNFVNEYNSSSSRNTSLTPISSSIMHDTIPKINSQLLNHRCQHYSSHQNQLQPCNQFSCAQSLMNQNSTIYFHPIHQKNQQMQEQRVQLNPCGCPYSTIDPDSNDTLVRSISSCSGRNHRGSELNNTIDIVGERMRAPPSFRVPVRRSSSSSYCADKCPAETLFTTSSMKWLLNEIDRVTSYSLREIPRSLAELADRVILNGRPCDSECLSEIIRRIAILVGGFMTNSSYLSDSHNGVTATTTSVNAGAASSYGSSHNSMNVSEILYRRAELNSSTEDIQPKQRLQSSKQNLPPQAQSQLKKLEGDENSSIAQLKAQLQKKYQLKVKELEAVLVWIASQLSIDEESFNQNGNKFKSANRFSSLLPGLCHSNPNLKPFLDDVLTRIKTIKDRNAFLIKEHAKISLSHSYAKSLR